MQSSARARITGKENWHHRMLHESQRRLKQQKIALGGEGKSEKITKEGSGKQIDNNDVYFNLLNNVRCTVTKWKNEIRVDIRKVRVLVFSLVIIF